MSDQPIMDIRTLSLEELTTKVLELGEKKFRAKQVYEWLWKKHALTFDEMTNLSLGFRDLLKSRFEILPISEDKVQNSTDGTIKVRYRLHDGHLIESVLIPVPEHDRFTVCVSSQVGCSLTCTFCATGRMGRIRNLSAAEIVDQVVKVNQLCQDTYNHHLTNIVYMGMGEPLLNYKETLRSVELISSPDGLGMSARRITISTAGIGKLIMKLADDASKTNLALSLHAADDIKRNEIMPINEQNSLAVLKDALKYFYQKTGNRLSYEYICFAGFNDQMEDAVALSKMCRDYPVRVNIIEYNPIDNAPMSKSDDDQISRFAGYLADLGVTVTVRRSRGKDIDAACGQLANKD